MRNLRYIWDISTVGLCSDNSLKDGFVRPKLPNVEKIGSLNCVGKGTVMFLTLNARQTFFLLKPWVKHLKFKVKQLTVSLRRSFNFLNVEYVQKLLMLVKQKRNLQQDLINIKVHIGFLEKRT